jgi:hypothetical protein
MDYTIGHVGVTPHGNVVFELVVPGPRRAHVTIPRKLATGDNIDAAIQHALAASLRPLRVT